MVDELLRNYKQQQIINHLKRCGGQRNFEITPKMLIYWWKMLNYVVFDDKLSINRVILKPVNLLYRTGNWAECGRVSYQTDKIFLRIDKTVLPKQIGRKGFLTILVHEMVHQYQLEYEQTFTHGSTFICWKSIIQSRIGLKLSLSVSVTDFEYNNG